MCRSRCPSSEAKQHLGELFVYMSVCSGHNRCRVAHDAIGPRGLILPADAKSSQPWREPQQDATQPPAGYPDRAPTRDCDSRRHDVGPHAVPQDLIIAIGAPSW